MCLSYLNTNTHTNVPYMVRSHYVYAAASRPTQQRQSPRLDLRLQLLIHDCYSPYPPHPSPPLRHAVPPRFIYFPPPPLLFPVVALDTRCRRNSVHTFCPRFRSTVANPLTSVAGLVLYAHTHTHARTLTHSH